MAFDVTGLVTPGSPVFRLRSNYEVYYDRVTLALDDAAEPLVVHELPPSAAVLRDRGYPREFSPDGRLPLLYDYGIMDPGYPFKRFAGSFTRFGDVRPLLLEADDRYVVFGHGEELTLRFRVDDLPPPGEGRTRTFLLRSAGWCKDMDPYTAFPDTVSPLPFRGMSGYPYGDGEEYPSGNRAWLLEWNTRQVLPR
jgi:hypothetical protein